MIISGDSNVPGLGSANNNIIPLITNLQASLKAPPAPDLRQEPGGSLQQPQAVVESPAETNNSLVKAVKATRPTCDNSSQQVTSLLTSVLHSHWLRNVEARLSLVERIIVMLRQLSYAIKNQLVASKAPY